MPRPHDAPVSAVAVGPDRAVWSGGYDGRLIGWAIDGDRLTPFVEHSVSTKNVNAIAAGPDGAIAAGCSANQVTVIRDGAMHVLPQRGDVEALAFAEDGRLACGGTGGQVSVWSSQLDLLAVLPHGGTVGALVFDGERLVTVCNDGRLRIFDRDLTLRTSSKLSQLPLKSVAPTPNGLLVGGHDATLRLVQGDRVEIVEILRTTAKALAASQGRIVSASYDGRLRVGFDPRRLALISRDPRIWAHGVATRGDLVAVGSFDGAPIVHQARGDRWIRVPGPAAPVDCISSLDTTEEVVTAGDSGIIHVDGAPAVDLGEPITSIRHTPRGLVAATWTGAVHIGLGSTRPQRVSLGGAPIVCCEVDGTDIVAGLYTGGVVCLDLDSGVERWICTAARGAVKSVAIHGDHVAVVGRYDPLRLLDRRTGDVLGTSPLDTSVSDIVRFSPSGRLLACAAGDFDVRIYDTAALGVAHQSRGHERPIKAMTWLDDQRLVSGDYAGVVRLHRVGAPSVVIARLSPRLGVSALALHHGRVAATTFDGDVEFIEAPAA